MMASVIYLLPAMTSNAKETHDNIDALTIQMAVIEGLKKFETFEFRRVLPLGTKVSSRSHER